VEKKEGTHRANNILIRIVDLPGTYSLTAFSEEEGLPVISSSRKNPIW